MHRVREQDVGDEFKTRWARYCFEGHVDQKYFWRIWARVAVGMPRLVGLSMSIMFPASSRRGPSALIHSASKARSEVASIFDSLLVQVKTLAL